MRLRFSKTAAPAPFRDFVVGLGMVALLSSAAPAIATEFEPYSVRPPIEQLRPSTPLGAFTPPRAWRQVQEAMLRFLAEMTVLYREEDLYFVGRDGEYLHDLARLLGLDRSRLHLINVSTKNLTDPRLALYLEQEGMTPPRLMARPAVIVDTGYRGTILTAIRRALPVEVAKRVRGQFVISRHADAGSSRVFLEALNPAVVAVAPSRFRGDLIEYEHLPHHTARADHFDRVGDRWEPMSPVATGIDARFRSASAKLRESLVAFAADLQTKIRFENLKSAMTEEKTRLLDPEGSEWPSVDLSALGVATFYQDLFEHLQKRGELAWWVRGRIDDLSPRPSDHIDRYELARRFPPWAEYLRQPHGSISALGFAERNLLIQLIAIADVEMASVLVKVLGSDPRFLDEPEALATFIRSENAYLLSDFLARSAVAQHPNGYALVRDFIDLDQGGLQILQNKDWWTRPGGHGLVEQFVRKTDGNLSIDKILSDPYWTETPDGPRLFRETVRTKSGVNALIHVLATEAWSRLSEAPELLELLIRAGATSYFLEDWLLKKPYWADHPTLRRTLGGARPTYRRLRRWLDKFSFTCQGALAPEEIGERRRSNSSLLVDSHDS